jgi:pentatricopeptide repeat protein
MAPQRAEQLLRRMQELSLSFPHLQPTIFTFNAVLEAYSKTAGSKNKRRQHQSQLAVLRLFQELQENLTPNTYTYNLVLTSQARFSEEWQSLEKWAHDYLDGNPTSTVKPDRQTINQLLKGYAEVGDADKAEKVLNQAIEISQTSAKGEKTPLEVSPVWFNLVLKGLARSQQSPEVADSSAGERADKLLRQMYSLKKSGFSKLQPDTSTYNHVLNVHAVTGDTDRADALVEELERAFITNLDGADLSADRITFTTLIKTYATKQRLTKSLRISSDIASNATDVFHRMQNLAQVGWPNLSPSIVTCKFQLLWFSTFS